MSDSNHPYRPYASGVGIFLGVVILWVGSYGIFWLGLKLFTGEAAGE